MAKFRDSFVNPPVAVREVNDGPELVETQGYVPAKKQIEDMIYAGERLAAARSEAYDYASQDMDDGVTMDPTRSPGFDLADAAVLRRQAESRLKDQKDAADKVTAAQKAQIEAKAKADAEELAARRAAEQK